MTPRDFKNARSIIKGRIEQPYVLALELIPKLLKEITRLEKELEKANKLQREQHGQLRSRWDHGFSVPARVGDFLTF